MAVVARAAAPHDAAELVRLRALMFESMGLDTDASVWRGQARSHLAEHLDCGLVLGAVVDAPDGSGLAASGLAELSVRIPSPANPSGRSAYLSSFSTDARWRRRGMARAVLSHVLGQLHDLGVTRVELHATPDGEPLYRSLGFTERHGGLEMRLLVAPRRLGRSATASA